VKDTQEQADGLSAEERRAVKERAQEVRAPRRGSKAKVDDEAAVLAKLAEMPEADRRLGEQLHALVKANAPDLKPKLWYGMPGYARNGKVVCFYQSAEKFKSRYSTFGFNEDARLDDGTMWPTAFALTELTAETEARLGELIKRA
jgi:uncharacterized protein YdhG (YjbR/CyaY superfamily)